jgi:hypothetical protein
VNTPSTPVLSAGRSKTVPAIVFLAVMAVAIGICFLLENVRPAVPRLRSADADETSSARRALAA